jgi:Integrase core domain
VTQDDLLYRFRLRVFAIAAELGNVRAACRAMGIHPCIYYRGSGSWTATAPRSRGRGSGGCRAWPIRPASWWSSGWSPSRSVIPGSGRPALQPSWPDPSGVGSCCRQWGVAGAVSPWPVDPGQALWPGGRPPRPTSSPAVAADLARRGWRLERVLSDNAQEFRAAAFQQTIANLGARHSFIRAGRPQTNGGVERVQQTTWTSAGSRPSPVV